MAEHPSSSNLDSEVEFVSFFCLLLIQINWVTRSFVGLITLMLLMLPALWQMELAVEICIAMGKAGMLEIFRAGGLHPRKVKEANS